MTKIKYSALVESMSGKLNGSVMSKNKSGHYIRTKTTPSNPQTSFQTAVRNSLASIAQAWRGLTDTQRKSWNTVVDQFQRTNIFGDSFKLSGIALYSRLNRNLDTIGSTRIATPPSPEAVSFFTGLSAIVDNSATTMELTFAPAIPAGSKVIVRASAPLSQGIYNANNKMRIIAVLDNTDTSPADVATEYQTKFGTFPAVGQKVFFDVKHVDISTGIDGVPLSTSAITIA